MKGRGSLRLPRFKLLTFLYAGLGLASGLALVRLVLRLLAADELSPVGRGLVELGGLVVLPWRLVLPGAMVGQLPGATLEWATLLAAVSYVAVASLIAATLTIIKGVGMRPESEGETETANNSQFQ